MCNGKIDLSLPLVPQAEDAFRRCRDKGFPTGTEMCIHQGNRHLLRETVRHLASLGCRAGVHPG